MSVISIILPSDEIRNHINQTSVLCKSKLRVLILRNQHQSAQATRVDIHRISRREPKIKGLVDTI